MGSAGSIIALLALADAFDDRGLVQDAVGGRRGTDPTRNRYAPRLVLGDPRPPLSTSSLRALAWRGRYRLGAARALRRDRRRAVPRRRDRRVRLRAVVARRPLRHVAGSAHWRASGGVAARRIASPAVGTWCHGEGGIALTRLRAIDVLGHELRCTTPRSRSRPPVGFLARALPHEIEDLSLCHGAAGAADVLLCGAAALGEPLARRRPSWRTNSDAWRSSATTPPGTVALRRRRRHDARALPRTQRDRLVVPAPARRRDPFAADYADPRLTAMLARA